MLQHSMLQKCEQDPFGPTCTGVWRLLCTLQARRTLSGLLKQGKDAIRQQDPDEAILAAKQASLHPRIRLCCAWPMCTRGSLPAMSKMGDECFIVFRGARLLFEQLSSVLVFQQ